MRSGGVSDDLRAPIPRQEFVNALGGMIRQAAEYIGEPSLRIDVVELGAGDEGVDGRGASAALIGACEGPISSSHGRLPFILPMSGRISRSTIVGIPILAGW